MSSTLGHLNRTSGLGLRLNASNALELTDASVLGTVERSPPALLSLTQSISNSSIFVVGIRRIEASISTKLIAHRAGRIDVQLECPVRALSRNTGGKLTKALTRGHSHSDIRINVFLLSDPTDRRDFVARISYPR